jgi:CDP-diacylglycerol---glycerol-3-phosphate 3-phosphatidyltransferase
MKIANAFTAVRIILAPFFFLIFFLPEWMGGRFSLASVIILVPLFIFMEFTDYLDGFFARRNNEVSDFGKVFDPFADVLANLTVLLTFVLAGYLNPLLYLVIIYREMGIMFIRMLAASNGVIIAARKGGKAKTVLYIVAAGFSLAVESCRRASFPLPFSDSIAHIVVNGLYVLAAVVSVASFLDYLYQFSGVLKKDSE